MGNRVTSVRIKRPDGTYSNEIPISPSADKVIWKDNEHNLEEILGNVDTTKPIQNQINQKVNTAELQEYIDTEMADDVGDWLEEHVIIPSGGTVAVDNTLSISEAAADSKTVGDIIDQSIAPKFSVIIDYKDGDYVYYENHLYKFVVDHAAGAWNATHVELANNVTKQIRQLETTIENGNFPEMAVGSADQLISDGYVVESEPYQFRRSGGSTDVGTRMEDVIVGGSIVWNQLTSNNVNTSTDNDVTFTKNNDGSWTLSGTASATASKIISTGISVTNGHKYFLLGGISDNICVYVNTVASWEGTRYEYGNGVILKCVASNYVGLGIQVVPGTQTNSAKLRPQLFDLTAMFGAEIADYIYSLEQATAGAGVAFFRKFFPKDYYAYNAGELISVGGLSEHKTVGFNVWDEEIESGTIGTNNGQNTSSTSYMRSKNYIRINSALTYYCKSLKTTYAFFYDKNKNYLGYAESNINNKSFIPVSMSNGLSGGGNFESAVYMRFRYDNETYDDEVCINFSDPAKNGTYEPYKGHSYPLDDSLTLRGIPKLDSNNQLYFDGDRYLANGVVERRYGIVDLGTLDWSYGNRNNADTGNIFYVRNLSIKKQTQLVCPKFTRATPYYPFWEDLSLGEIQVDNSQYMVACSTEANASAFKAAMSGVYLVYELATPTSETADPYHNPQIVDPEGTEEYVCTSLVPVGHETKYFEDLKGKIENDIGNLSDLTTTAKSNLVAAVNQLNSQVVEVDATLSVQGDAADSKKVGDEITQLKENLKELGGIILDITIPTTNTNFDVNIPKGSKVYVKAQNISHQTNVFFRKNGTVINSIGLTTSSLSGIVTITDDIDSVRLTDNNSSSATISIQFINQASYDLLNPKIESLEDSLDDIDESFTNVLMQSKILDITNPTGQNTTYNVFIPANTYIVITMSGVTATDYVNCLFKDIQSSSIDTLQVHGVTEKSFVYHTSQDVYAVRITDNTHSDVKVIITPYYASSNLYGINEQTVQRFVDDEKRIDSLENVKYLYDYHEDLPSSVINSFIKGANTANNINSGDGTNIANIGDDITQHDSSFVIYGGYAYVVYAGNSVSSDNASSATCKVRLAKINLQTFEKTMFVVAQNGMSIGTHEMTGGAGQPNIVNANGILHIWFTANIDNVYQLGYCTFDTSTDTLSNYDIVKFKGSNVTSYSPLTIENLNTEFGTALNISNYHSQQANSSIGYFNNYYYIGLVYGRGTGMAVIFKSSNLKEWEVFADYRDIPVRPMCELAVYIDSSGLYSAVRPMSDRATGAKNAMYGYLAKHNHNTGKLLDYVRFKNCGCRPSFFLKSPDIILFTNPMDRDYGDFIVIDTAVLRDSELWMHYKNFSYCYNTIIKEGDYFYTTYSGSGGICFRKFAFSSISDNEIKNTLLGLFELDNDN